MGDKQVSATAAAAFLCSAAIAIQEAGGKNKGSLMKRLNLHLDSSAESASPLSDRDRADLQVLRASFERYLKVLRN